MRKLVLAMFSCSLLACGGGSNGGGGGGGDDAQAPDAPFGGEQKYSVQWGPVTVSPNTESTQCIWLRLSNDAEIKVHAMHNVLTDGSHHLIVYKDDLDTTEQTTPMPCQPFRGALNSSMMIAPVAITQRKDDTITLPERVAYTFAPHQMIKLEMHYTNKGDTDLSVMANVDFFSADPATVDYEAGVMFTGSPDIQIPAGNGMTFDLHQFFTVPATVDLSQAKFFAITGHTHALGTSVKVKVGLASDPAGQTEVYAPDPFNWAEPETATPPEFSIPAGGGFDFECTWTNDHNAQVNFGESATDEMCFFWAYYYPSIGSRVCFHTSQYGGHDVCCPGDPQICSIIESQF